MFNLEYLESAYFFKDKPVPYELMCGSTINIYPISVENSDLFFGCKDILDINKNEIDNVEIIQMSYLQFVLEYCDVDKLIILLQLCLHEQDDFYTYEEKNKKNLVICDKDKNVKYIIKSKDFEDIRKIILYQNIIDYDDTYINKNIRDMMNKMNEAQTSNLKPITLEDKLVFVSIATGHSFDYLYKLSYRKFIKMFIMASERDTYMLNRQAELSGNVKFDKPLEHYIYKTNKGKYDDYFVAKNKIDSKMSQV